MYERRAVINSTRHPTVLRRHECKASTRSYLHALHACKRSRVARPDIQGDDSPFPEDRLVLLLCSWLLSEQATHLTGSAKKQNATTVLNSAQPTSDLPCSFENKDNEMLYNMCLHALSTVIFPVRVVLCNITHWEHPPMVSWKQSPVETATERKRKKYQAETCSLLSWEIPSCSPVKVLQRQWQLLIAGVTLHEFCLYVSPEKKTYSVKMTAALAAGCAATVPVVQGAAAFLGIISPRRSTDSQHRS